MGAKKVSNVTFMPAVEGISRKWALRRETCTPTVYNRMAGMGTTGINIPGKTYMGSTQRVINYNGLGPVQKNTFFMRRPMAAQRLTQTQTEKRNYFSAAAAWTKAAMNDITAIASNRPKYNAAKADYSLGIKGVNAYGYSSMRNWMFAIAYQIQQQGDSLPQDHILPNFDA